MPSLLRARTQMYPTPSAGYQNPLWLIVECVVCCLIVYACAGHARRIGLEECCVVMERSSAPSDRDQPICRWLHQPTVRCESGEMRCDGVEMQCLVGDESVTDLRNRYFHRRDP
jgi:hypothetical protein